MGFLQKISAIISPAPEERKLGSGFGSLFYGTGSGYVQEKSLTISAVYRAVDVISNSVAQLPFEVYSIDSQGYKTRNIKHPVNHVINCEPNRRMTRFTFVKLLVTSMLLKGNAYAYIKRDAKGNAEQLIFIPYEYVTIIPPQYIDEPVSYEITGFPQPVSSRDMIHILNFSPDGVIGISTIQHAANSLGIAYDADAHARGFFSGGCNLGGVLKVNSTLTDKQREQLKTSWRNTFDTETGAPNSVCILEGNMEYSPVTVNAADAQLLETREFSVVEIARWFGVSPVKLFDLSKSSYSTVEATNLSYLSDTISPILDKFELEFRRKLFPEHHDNLTVAFNTAALLRTDKQSLANYFTSLFNIGVVSINEIRREIDYEPVENGDSRFVQVNIQTVERACSADPDDSQTIKENLQFNSGETDKVPE